MASIDKKENVHWENDSCGEPAHNNPQKKCECCCHSGCARNSCLKKGFCKIECKGCHTLTESTKKCGDGCKGCPTCRQKSDSIPEIPSPTQPDQKDCKHGNKGVCLGCYVDEFRKTKPDTKWNEAKKFADDAAKELMNMPLKTESWEEDVNDYGNEITRLTMLFIQSKITRENRDESYAAAGHKLISKLHQVEEKSKQVGIQVGVQDGRHSAYREIEEALEKIKCNPGDVVTGWVVPMDDVRSVIKSKLSQPE